MVSAAPRAQLFYSYVASKGLGMSLNTSCGISGLQGLHTRFSGQQHLREDLPNKICQNILLKRLYKTTGMSNVCPVRKWEDPECSSEVANYLEVQHFILQNGEAGRI